MTNRILDENNNFISPNAAKNYANPLEKEVLVLKEDNKTLKKLNKQKSEEIRDLKKDFNELKGKYVQLEKELEELCEEESNKK